MAYRSGTYIAFDGLGHTDPSQSDYKYYSIIQGWNASNKIDFKFVNSHEKASSVRDTSSLDTLKASIRERLASSKNMVVILSDKTRRQGSVLSWEIEKAVDTFSLPLILAYTGCDVVMRPAALADRWPNTLSERLNNKSAAAIHVPFRKEALFYAIQKFGVNGEKIDGSFVHYTEKAHRDWGYI